MNEFETYSLYSCLNDSKGYDIQKDKNCLINHLDLSFHATLGD